MSNEANWLRSKVMSNRRLAIVVLVALVRRGPCRADPGQGTARRARRRHRIHPAAGAQLHPARRQAETARLLADPGVDRHRSDHLRPAVALRAAPETADRRGHVAITPGVPPATFAKIREYSLLFWANRGNHNELTSQKFVPTFTSEEWQDAALKARAAGAFASASGDLPPLATADAVKKELADLNQAIFDPAFEPMTTAKTPPAGQGHPAGERQHVLPGRHARRSEVVPGEVPAQLAGGEGRARHSRGGLSRRHAGREGPARSLRDLSQEGERVSREARAWSRIRRRRW